MEERTSRAFEDRMLRRIFGPKCDEITNGWEKFLVTSRFHDLYFMPCNMMRNSRE
jgi:hypothetical protein